jgi:hypothetical protein
VFRSLLQSCSFCDALQRYLDLFAMVDEGLRILDPYNHHSSEHEPCITFSHGHHSGLDHSPNRITPAPLSCYRFYRSTTNRARDVVVATPGHCYHSANHRAVSSIVQYNDHAPIGPCRCNPKWLDVEHGPQIGLEMGGRQGGYGAGRGGGRCGRD